jgi:hypothetical protein
MRGETVPGDPPATPAARRSQEGVSAPAVVEAAAPQAPQAPAAPTPPDVARPAAARPRLFDRLRRRRE